MSTFITVDYIEELVGNNSYKQEGNEYKSRCFSSSYDRIVDLPALSLPGGDIGDLAIFLAAAESYGFDLNIDKAIQELIKLIGSTENTTFNNLTSHSAKDCCYLHLLLQRPENYSLDRKSMEILIEKAKPFGLTQEFAEFTIKKPQEHACIILESSGGLYPEYTFDTVDGPIKAKFFVVHKTLVDKRHKVLIQKLLEKKAVTLYEGLNADYLYEVISEMTDNHLYETMKTLAPDMPIYGVKVDDKDKIVVELYS